MHHWQAQQAVRFLLTAHEPAQRVLDVATGPFGVGERWNGSIAPRPVNTTGVLLIRLATRGASVERG